MAQSEGSSAYIVRQIAELVQAGKPASALCVTPLHHFCSDAPELVIGAGSKIRRFEGSLASSDDIISATLKICQPDYLLLQSSLLSLEYFVQDLSSLSGQQRAGELLEDCLSSTRELLRVLRLFKPGRLRAAETFVMLPLDDEGHWESVASGRASDMAVDYSLLRVQEKSYVLDSSDMSSLRTFQERVLPVLRQMSAFPALELALFLYGSDNRERLDVIEAFTGLEALLTTNDEVEGLTHRLSMRVANLLGNDADDRRTQFLEVKKFYNLRSKIVHGSRLRETLLNQMGELHRLRETLRRVLLSVMALFSEGVRADDLPALLDELAFDDEKRKQVQAAAARFLHIGAGEGN